MKNIMIAVALLASVTVGVFAQEEGKPAGFKHSLSAGVTMTDGNSETMQANLSMLTEGEKESLGSVRAGAEFNYGESTVERESTVDGVATVEDVDETTVENARAFANAKKTMSPLTFGYVDVSFLYDDIAMVDHRFVAGPGLGVYPLKNDITSLLFEAGPSYVWEKVADVSDDYLAVRFAERFTHALSDTAKVWQSAEYLPKADDFGDYLLSAEVGVEAALNAHLNLGLVLRDKYDSEPGEGLEKNDLALIGRISVSL